MQKLMNKLSALDGETPRRLNENAMAECGDGVMTPSPMMSNNAPHTPASISITANNGPELSGMLRDIMTLAGVHKVEPQHMPVVSQPSPAIPMGHDMRQIIDSMNDEPAEEVISITDDGDEDGDFGEVEQETDEGYANTPDDATAVPEYDGEENAFNPNAGGDRRNRKSDLPKAMPVDESVENISAHLFMEYSKFINS